MPSTIANIFDLLMDYKNVVRKNPDISTLYVCYQVITNPNSGINVISQLPPLLYFLSFR